jgi:hypothetical protein
LPNAVRLIARFADANGQQKAGKVHAGCGEFA